MKKIPFFDEKQRFLILTPAAKGFRTLVGGE